jgi:hypothetical protein
MGEPRRLPPVDHSARIKRISAPVASPGKCAICGKPKHPQGFAATDNFDFEFYGTVYFCYDCIGDYARIFGFMSREEIEDLLARLTNQTEELKILRASVVNLETIVDAYTSLRGPLSSNPVPVISDADSATPSDEGTVSGEGSNLRLVTEASGDSVSGEQSVSERGDEPGRDDVHDSGTDILKELGIDIT